MVKYQSHWAKYHLCVIGNNNLSDEGIKNIVKGNWPKLANIYLGIL